MPATPGYNEASKRAAAAAKVETQKQAAEEAAKRQILERQRTPGYVSSLDQNPEQALNQSFTARERREISAASAKVQAKADAKQFAVEEFTKAKEAAGPGKVVSQTLRIDTMTGTVSGYTTSRGIRSEVPARQYTTEYENPQYNQFFGSRRVGDILRTEQAKKDAALSEARSIPDFGDVLYSQTTRRTIDNEAAKAFSREYGQMQLSETRDRKGAPDFGIATPRKGGTIIEEITSTGEIVTYARPKLSKHYFVNIGNEQLGFGANPDVETPKGGIVEGFTNYFTNIGEFALSGGSLIREPNYKPEVEGSAIGSLVNLGSRAIGGQKANVNLLLFSKEIGDVGRQFQKNPAYGTGSVLGTAVFTGATFFIGPAVKGARFVPRFLQESIFARNTKIRTPGGFTQIEDRPFQIQPRLQYEYTPRSAYDPYGVGFGRTDEISMRIAERRNAFLKEIERAEETRDPIGSRFAPKDITTFKPFKDPDLGFGGKVQSTFKTITQPIIKTETEAEKIALQTDKDILRVTQAEKAGAAARAEEKAQKMAEKITRVEPGILGAGETSSGKRVSLMSGKRYEGNLSKFLGTSGNLGLGGLTGAERTRSRRIVPDYESQLVSYPPSVNAAENLGLRLDSGIKPVSLTTPRSDIFSIPRSRADSASGLKQSGITFIDQGLRQEALPIISPIAASKTQQGLKQNQALRTSIVFRSPFGNPLTVSISRNPPPSSPPRKPVFPIIDFGLEEPERRGKKKGRKRRYSERAFPAIEIFPGTKLAKMFKIE